MHIKKGLPHDNYTKISNLIIRDARISDGAVRLYCFIASLPNGKTIHDGYLARSLDVSQRTITTRKNELKALGLIHMEQLAPRVFDLYVGYPNMPAVRVKEKWDRDNG